MNVYVGYDPRYQDSFNVTVKSIAFYDKTVNIVPLKIEDTEETRTGSTSFTFTRFWVPYLENYKGISIFVDGDFVFKDAISNLKTFLDTGDVSVVKHKKVLLKGKIKFDTNPQLNYAKKYWSSLMVFNNEKCKILNPEYLKDSSFSHLHQFQWTKNVDEIPKNWNILVGYQKEKNVKALHYTDGVPLMKGYQNCDYKDEWLKFYEKNL